MTTISPYNNAPVLPTAAVPDTPETGYAQDHLNYLAANSPAFAGKEKDVAKALASIDASTALGAETQIILANLIKMLATIRKEQRNLSVAQANNVFATAKLSAQHQLSQAQNRYSSEMANASAGLVGGFIESASAAGSLAYGAIKSHGIQQAANAKDWTKPVEQPNNQANRNATASENDYVDTPTKQGVDFYEAPPAYELEDSMAKPRMIPAAKDDIDFKKTGAPTGTDSETEAANTPAARTEPDLQAKAQWISEQQRMAWQKADMASRLITSVGQMVSSSIKMGGAAWEREAGIKQAEVTLQKAFEDYVRNQQNMSAEYERDMRDWLNKIIELLKSIEGARHRTFENLLV